MLVRGRLEDVEETPEEPDASKDFDGVLHVVAASILVNWRRS